jgi:ubiquinol-cytochrome c reductase cytochrome b subunit
VTEDRWYPVIELWQDEGGFWQWLFHDPREHINLHSNRGFVSREEALETARVAYPGVPLIDLGEEADKTESSFRPKRRRLRFWAMLAIGATGLSILAILLAVTGLAVGAGIAWTRVSSRLRR